MNEKLNLCWILLFAGCSYTQTKNDSSSDNKSDSLKLTFAELKTCNLDYNNLYDIVSKASSTGAIIDRNKDNWMYNLQIKDSMQFEMAHQLKPICKLFETHDVLSIVFQDTYDYKQALHVYNFRKPKLEPVSSFIMFDLGGDAEDFWHVDCKQIDLNKYELTNSSGHYNNIVTRDTTYFDLRQGQAIEIDQTTGRKTKAILRTEKNIIKIK